MSNISKLSKIPRSARQWVVFWTILKYYEPVLGQNTTYRSCYYLFIIEAKKFSVIHRRPLFVIVEKTNTGFCIPNNLFTSMEKKKGLPVFCKTITNHWRQTTWNGSKKEIFKSQFLQSLQWWSETTNEDKLRASFSQCLIAALLKNTQHQHHCLLSPNSHKSGGLLFGKLESQFGCAVWANYTCFCKFQQRIKSDICPVL